MFIMHVALVAKEEGNELAVFKPVDSLDLTGFYIEGANNRTYDEWKNAILHYAAMEQCHEVHFSKVTEHCYLRRDSFPAEHYPGNTNYAFFPVEENPKDGSKA